MDRVLLFMVICLLSLVSVRNVLEVAREMGCAVFTPSSIGVFGNNTPKDIEKAVMKVKVLRRKAGDFFVEEWLRAGLMI